MVFSRSNLFLIVAFVLVLLAVISYATTPIAGVNPAVWAWGGVDSFILSFITVP